MPGQVIEYFAKKRVYEVYVGWWRTVDERKNFRMLSSLVNAALEVNVQISQCRDWSPTAPD